MEKETNELTDMQIIEDVKKDLDSANDKYGKIHERMKEDQAFCAAINDGQWNNNLKDNWGKNRIHFSASMLDKYVERVIGGYINNPFGIKYSSKASVKRPQQPQQRLGHQPQGRQMMGPAPMGQPQPPMGQQQPQRPQPEPDRNQQKARVLEGIVAGIESRSKANDAYREALRNSTTTGYGYLYLRTEYANPDDDSLDVELLIENISNPSAVLYDPKSIKLDGSDANFCAYLEPISKREAKQLYGEYVCESHGSNIWEDAKYITDEDSVPVITYFRKEKTRKKVWFDSEGNVSEEEIKGARTKDKIYTKVQMYKIVGYEVVDNQVIDMPCLPIIPVYGLTANVGDKMEFVGIVNRAKDSQTLINFATSLGAERLALGVKAQFIAEENSLTNSLNGWLDSQTTNQAVLTYKGWHGDKQLNPPIAINQSVNLTDTQQVMSSQRDMLAGVIGIPDDGMGIAQRNNETAQAALLRQRSAETVLASLYSNLATSVEQMGKALLYAIRLYYDVPRTVPLKFPDGHIELTHIAFDNLNLLPTEYEVTVESGPLLGSERKEKLNSLLALSQIAGKEMAVTFLPEIVSCIDSLDPAIQQKAQFLADKALNPNANPQKMQQQMAQTQQQIKALTQENTQLRTELTKAQETLKATNNSVINEQMRIRADIMKTQMNNENALDVQRMKSGYETVLQDQKAEDANEQIILKERLQLEKDMKQREMDIQEEIARNTSISVQAVPEVTII